jgi:hypothetical protein
MSKNFRPTLAHALATKYRLSRLEAQAARIEALVEVATTPEQLDRLMEKLKAVVLSHSIGRAVAEECRKALLFQFRNRFGPEVGTLAESDPEALAELFSTAQEARA